jgi:RNA polymerase sigma-70 factor (ECF subfamily)
MQARTLESDERLVANFREHGREGELAEIVDRHWAGLYRLALGITRDPGSAEDAAQEALIRFVGAARRGPIDVVRAWLRSAVVNEARKHLRSRARRLRHETRGGSRAGPAETGGIEEHVAQLPLELREPLVLHYGLGYTHAEVGEALGCPAGTASSRIRLGLERLRGEALTRGAAFSIGSLAGLATLREARAPRAPSATALLRAASKPLAIGLSTKALSAVFVAAALVLGTHVVRTISSEPGDTKIEHPVASASSPGGGTAPDVAVPASERPVGSMAAPAGAPIVSSDSSAASTDDAADENAANEVHVVYGGHVVDEQSLPVPGARVTLTVRVAPEASLSDAMRMLMEESALGRVIPPEISQVSTEDSFAIVQGMARTLASPLEVTVSQDDGSFELSLASQLPAGTVVSVSARAGDPRGLGGEKTVTIASSGALDLGEVVVKRLPVVTLHVTSSGVPVQGAHVAFTELSEGLFSQDEGPTPPETDSSGYARHAAATRLVQIRVEARGLATENRNVRVEGDMTVDLELVPGARIAGTVRGADGTAIEGATVSLQEESPSRESTLGMVGPVAQVETDGDGRFILEGAKIGPRYVVNVEPHSDWLPASVTVTAPGPSLDVALQPGGRLVVSVVAADGVAIVDSILDAVDLEQRDPETGEWTDAGCSGDVEMAAVVFKPLAPGTYRVRCPYSAASDPIEVRAGSRSDARIEVTGGRTIHGRVVDARGCPVEGAFVVSEHVGETTTGRDGSYSLDNVPPSEVSLMIVKVVAAEAQTATVEVPRGVTTVADAVLQKGPR